MYERIGLIVLLSFGMFYRTLKLGFVSDDLAVFRDTKKPKPRNKWHRLWLELSSQGIYVPQEMHLMTMCIHALVCVLIYLGLGKSDVSFLAALLFCINPSNAQGSIWSSGRKGYVLPTLWLMLSMTLPYVAPIALFYATMPATAFIYPIAFLGSPHWWFILIMPVIWYINLKRFKGQVKTKMEYESQVKDKVFTPRKLILAVKTYAYYCFIGVVPDKLGFYHSFMQSGAGSGNNLMSKRAYALDTTFWFGCSIMALCLFCSIHNWTGITWGMFWFSICILPYLNLIRVQQEISHRYMYCANVGLMFALAGLIANYPVIITAFLVMYATRLWYHIPAWNDDYVIREYNIIEDKNCWFAWHWRGIHRWETGSRHEALAMWVMANLISPQEFKVLANIAMALRKLNKIKESDFYLNKARENMIKGQEAQSEDILRKIKANENGKMPICI